MVTGDKDVRINISTVVANLYLKYKKGANP